MTMTLGAIGGKRDTFLQRIAAMLVLRGRGRFTDTDVADVAQLALIRPTARRSRPLVS
jgi:hypothetical protein